MAQVFASSHTPVLYQEVLHMLAPRPGGRYIDGTLGGGGHALGILAASAPDGRLLGLDADPTAATRVRQLLAPFGDRAIVLHANFRRLAELAPQYGFAQVEGVLLDLGLSSFQLDAPGQGFSFQQDAPLDMRFDPAQGVSAADVVNTFEERALADILYRFGEERLSRRIARSIVARRPIHSTMALAEVISRAVGGRKGERLHPATRSFQALRIYVNEELAALEEALPQAIALLKPGGVLAVITFHSLEDRIVKHYFRRESQACLCPPEWPVCQCGHHASIELVQNRGVTPGAQEVAENPRSRSARLRGARKLKINN
ncbi:MAG: 16S rRNA (cytosine(1402)-N(4))-methyltransferase RsmH [Caldilineales bacterium]|nr:16S rRNA (cytosine(1402)-N(4))-methyltransferase RsmH [Caldilineales bacterium]